MKTVGIIGGVGPETTAKIYLEIVRRFRAIGQSRYPAITIYNMPFSYKVEKDSAINGINMHKMIPHLISAAKTLELSGADFGILPCNTLHKYIGKIRASVQIPFISILEETSLFIQKLEISTIGILATNSTVHNKLYEKALKESRINIIYPTLAEQKKLSHIISDLLAGKPSPKHAGEIKNLATSLCKRGAQGILLGCTDLQLVAEKIDHRTPVVDTTEVLIQAALRELLKQKSSG